MLTVKFKEQDLELKFGLGELNALDKLLGLDIREINVGQGLNFLVPNLKEGNPISLAKIIKACTRSYKVHPKTDAELEEVLMQVHADYGKFYKFGEAIIEEMGKHVMTQDMVAEDEEQLKAEVEIEETE